VPAALGAVSGSDGRAACVCAEVGCRGCPSCCGGLVRSPRCSSEGLGQAAGISASIWLLNLEVWEGRARVSAGREGADRKARPQPSPSPPALTEEPFTKGRFSWEPRGRNAASVSNFLLNMAALTHSVPLGSLRDCSALAASRSPPRLSLFTLCG